MVVATDLLAPVDLDDVKDDLGIKDYASDEWLCRRLNGIWSRIETYTSRKLCAPPQGFMDDWSEIAVAAPFQPAPMWALAWPPTATVFLRYHPVVSIDGISFNGTPGDPAAVRFDPRTGKLLTLRNPQIGAEDLSRELIGSRVQVTYKSGWTEIPADLYEVVLGSIQVMWNSRQAQAAGLPPGGLSVINLIDVGSVEVGTGGNTFEQAAMKGVGNDDPLLGPWVNILDHYVDHRSRIGSALFPTTRSTAVAVPHDDTFVGPAPPSIPYVGQLWFNNSDGQGGGHLYIYYNDGTSLQWVPASAVDST